MIESVCVQDIEYDAITVGELRDALLHVPQTLHIYIGDVKTQRARGISGIKKSRMTVEVGLRVIIPNEEPAPGPMVITLTSRPLDTETMMARKLLT